MRSWRELELGTNSPLLLLALKAPAVAGVYFFSHIQ